MKKKLLIISTSNAIALVVLVLNTSPAYAYLDPGTGSAILQGVLGTLAAVVVVAKLYWHRILRFLGLSKKPVEPKEGNNKKDE